MNDRQNPLVLGWRYGRKGIIAVPQGTVGVLAHLGKTGAGWFADISISI